jgi:hypothetical protein
MGEMHMRWIVSDVVRGFIRWAVGIVIGAVCLIWGFAPSEILAAWFGRPHEWMASPLTRLFVLTAGIVAIGALVLIRYKPKKSTAAIPYETWKDLDQIDLETAAAIWSGTREESDVTRHLRFRALKQAARRGQLNTYRRVDGKINRLTTVKPSDLVDFFASPNSKERLEEAENNAEPDKDNHSQARLKLAELRADGVAMRNAAQNYLDSSAFLMDTTDWMSRTILAIKAIDEADAEWFKTLDAVPPPRVPHHPNASRSLAKAFREHDLRLARLDQLINRYAERVREAR